VCGGVGGGGGVVHSASGQRGATWQTGGPSDAILRCGSGRRTGFASCAHRRPRTSESAPPAAAAHGQQRGSAGDGARRGGRHGCRLRRGSCGHITQRLGSGARPGWRHGRPHLERAAQLRREGHHRSRLENGGGPFNKGAPPRKFVGEQKKKNICLQIAPTSPQSPTSPISFLPRVSLSYRKVPIMRTMERVRGAGRRAARLSGGRLVGGRRLKGAAACCRETGLRRPEGARFWADQPRTQRCPPQRVTACALALGQRARA